MRERGEGSFRWKRKRAEVRVYLGPPIGRRAFLLTPAITTDGPAQERAALLAGFAARLRAAGRAALGLPLIERLAGAEAARDVKAAAAALEAILAGEATPLPTGAITFRKLAEQWTSGELARLYPDHVRAIDHEGNVYRLEKHVLPTLKDVPIVALEGPPGLEYAQAVMRQIPADSSAATRRHVAQLLHRLLSLAVFPLRILKANPLPRGFLPKVRKDKAKAHLYPDEDRKLLAFADVPLCDRMTYGFLHREGMRASEAAALERTDLDLERGAVALDENKTDDPRAWALRPDVVRALRAWFKLRDAQGDHDPRVFPRSFDHAADRFRAHLEAAGIERPQLFERSKARRPIRFHDTRATFVTIALANGRTEAWIADRTGHKSSDQIATYRRGARTVGELGLGDLVPLDTAIPELAPFLAPPGVPSAGSPDGGASGSGRGPDGASSRQGSRRTRKPRRFAHARARSRRMSAFRFQRGHSREGSSPSLRTDAEALGFSEDAAVASEADAKGAGPERAPNNPTDAAGSPVEQASGRGDAIGRLAGMLATFAAAGDLEGARTMHEAIGRLLAPAASPQSGAEVVDLQAARKRRAGR